MNVYYNEFDPKAAAWLRQLIDNGNIAPGYVDERSILDVKPEALEGYTQHHFFAGIGVWSYALRNAGWSDATPVCTASLPCQPFSGAGNHKGKDDERHLLPHFMQLVKQCGFNTIFGEQVASAIGHGWLDDLQTNMEAEGYAVGHCVLGAHSVNAAHQRQRVYWVAHSIGTRHEGRLSKGSDKEREDINGHLRCDSSDSRLDNPLLGRHINEEEKIQPRRERAELSSIAGGMGNTQCERPGSDIEWLYCRDNKYRPIKSSIKPLVNGLARGVVYSGGAIDPNNTAFARAIRLKGYGNAINADVAELFISTFMEVTDAEEQ